MIVKPELQMRCKFEGNILAKSAESTLSKILQDTNRIV
jgi:hypothetical protein